MCMCTPMCTYSFACICRKMFIRKLVTVITHGWGTERGWQKDLFFTTYLFLKVEFGPIHYVIIKSYINPLQNILFIFRKRGRKGEREGENINIWLPPMRPHQGPGPKPRQVACLGMKPATLWFAGWCSIHWATPAGA